MKSIKVMLFAALALVAFACGDSKESEKRIAELESRLAEIEGKGTATTAQPVVEEKPTGPLPEFLFDNLEYDFGTINDKDPVEYIFSFTNNGQAPLIIQDAKGSCGCTVPSYTKTPIAIGGDGKITVKFNPGGKSGIQNKTVTLTANTWPKTSTLRIKANVVKSDAPIK